MILVGGENLIDLIEADDGRFAASLGGGPFNVARTLARQGQNVGYLTPVSTDAMGNRLATALQNDGVALLAPRSPAPSSLALVSLQNGQAHYQFYRRKTAERRVSAAMLNRIIPKQAKAFQLGSLALTSGKDADIWAQIYRALHRRGVMTALDPNIRPAFIKKRRKYLARLDWILPKTDLLKLSEEDLAWLDPTREPEAAATHLRRQHAIPLLVLTLGDKGAKAFTSQGYFSVPAPKATPFVDTIGAGDTFMGSLLAQLSRADMLAKPALERTDEARLRPCLDAATKAATLSCQFAGATPP